jgi:hypothetical protein
MLEAVAESFERCVKCVNDLFLCTVAQELWDDFGSTAKKALLRGLAGDVKTVLNLDSG